TISSCTSSSGTWPRLSSDGRTARSSWRWALPASASPPSACWRSRAALICVSRPVVGPACFLWGAAAGHVYQMIAAHHFAPGNAGVIFYSDILVPLVGFLFLWLQRGSEAPAGRTTAL